MGGWNQVNWDHFSQSNLNSHHSFFFDGGGHLIVVNVLMSVQLLLSMYCFLLILRWTMTCTHVLEIHAGRRFRCSNEHVETLGEVLLKVVVLLSDSVSQLRSVTKTSWPLWQLRPLNLVTVSICNPPPLSIFIPGNYFHLMPASSQRCGRVAFPESR